MTPTTLRFEYDVLLDLGDSGAEGRCWAEMTGLRWTAGRVGVLTSGPRQRRLAAWWRAVCEARAARRHLLVVLGPVPVGSEALPPLLAELEADPMLGAAQPRFADARTDRLWTLPPDAGDHLTSRAALPGLPAGVITAELLCACLLLRREVVDAMQQPDGVATVAGALALELARARRRGFRNVVVNRAVVPCDLPPSALYPQLAAEDAARLHEAYPDATIAAEENRALPERQLERLLSAAYPGAGERRSLLLDCRGLSALHNGTAQCMLGILDGFAALDTAWAIHVQSSPEAAAFHRLPERYPGFTHRQGALAASYAAILLQNQPWSVEHIAELHRHGLLIGFHILDTISWDILYMGPPNLDRTWRFAARHADILTFISAYSRDRFRRRFPLAPGVRDAVVHLSLAAEDQRIEALADLPAGEHILLFGNAYEHKGLEPAIRLLAAAFPFERFVALGAGGPTPPNVRGLPSGTTDAAELHRLVATAKAVVYPSHYEGFGLPVLEGLAYGRPVLVRSNKLWTEIAAHCRFEAALIPCEDDAALIERLASVLAGEPAPSLPFATALAPDDAPFRWQDAAAAMLRTVEEQLAEAGTDHWRARAESLRLAGLG